MALKQILPVAPSRLVDVKFRVGVGVGVARFDIDIAHIVQK